MLPIAQTLPAFAPGRRRRYAGRQPWLIIDKGEESATFLQLDRTTATPAIIGGHCVWKGC